jgi:hypothetical protein
MIRLFEINNKNVVPTEHCYVISWLKVIMDKYPDCYMKVYAYIFYMTCPGPENPYFNMKDVDVEDVIIHDLDGITFSTEDDEIIDALENARKLFETPTVRAHKGLKIAMDNIAEYMAETGITDGKDGNIGQIRAMAKDFDGIRQSYKGVSKDLEEEQKAAHVRGNQRLAYDQ